VKISTRPLELRPAQGAPKAHQANQRPSQGVKFGWRILQKKVLQQWLRPEA